MKVHWILAAAVFLSSCAGMRDAADQLSSLDTAVPPSGETVGVVPEAAGAAPETADRAAVEESAAGESGTDVASGGPAAAGPSAGATPEGVSSTATVAAPATGPAGGAAATAEDGVEASAAGPVAADASDLPAAGASTAGPVTSEAGAGASTTGQAAVETAEAASKPAAGQATAEVADVAVPSAAGPATAEGASTTVSGPATVNGAEAAVSGQGAVVTAGSESEPLPETAVADAAAAADAEAEPLPPPLPDPLDSRQINRLVFTGIGEALLPVHRSGSAVYLLHDIDGNGYSDVFALAVRVDRREAAEFANINDYTRLYRAEGESMKFYLRLFYQRNGTLVPADLVSLGERLVVDSFSPQSIIEGKNTPFAISIVFTTLQGRVREWVIFAGNKPVRFSMQERTGELPRVEDIDRDGVVDVVIYEETYEIGIGNETFMTWYRWNGAEFSRRATVNIVRNLQEFLDATFEAIRNEDWSDFSRRAFSQRMRAVAADEEYSSFSIFHRVFTLAAVEESFKNQAIASDEIIRQVIYPEIRENPFSQRDSLGFFFPLSVRFETSAGRNHLYTTRIYMLSNPFGERQFTFAVKGS